MSTIPTFRAFSTPGDNLFHGQRLTNIQRTNPSLYSSAIGGNNPDAHANICRYSIKIKNDTSRPLVSSVSLTRESLVNEFKLGSVLEPSLESAPITIFSNVPTSIFLNVINKENDQWVTNIAVAYSDVQTDVRSYPLSFFMQECCRVTQGDT